MDRFASENNRELFRIILRERLEDAFPLGTRPEDALLDFQISELENVISLFNPNKVAQRYRKDVRINKQVFFKDMAKLILHKQKMVDNDSIYVKLPVSHGNEDKFQIPTPNGSMHLIEQLTKFLFSYYEDNPPFKYIKGLMPPLTEDYILTTHADLINRPNYVDDSILQYAKLLAFPLQLLSKIRNFQQFPKGQRKNSVITEKQAKFIIIFLALIDYEKWRSKFELIVVNVKPITEERLKIEAKALRNQIISYRKIIDQTPDWR